LPRATERERSVSETALPDVPSAKPRLKRPVLVTTVHPDTVTRLDAVCNEYRTYRGQVIDKLVGVLFQQLDSVKRGQPSVFCLTGERCRLNRSDVPPTL